MTTKIDKSSPANASPAVDRASPALRAPASAPVKNTPDGSSFDGGVRKPRRVNLSGAAPRVNPKLLAEMLIADRAARGLEPQGPSAPATAATRPAADGLVGQDPLRRLVDENWNNLYQLERVLSGQVRPGPLSADNQARLGKMLVEKHLSMDGGMSLSRLGDEQWGYPNVARALGRAFDAGTLTDAHLTQLLGPQGLGAHVQWGYEYYGIANLVAASGSSALQSAAATRIWDLAARQPDRHKAMDFQTAAMRATGGSPPATQALLQRAGPQAMTAAVDTVAYMSIHAPLRTDVNRYSTALGNLLTGVAGLPNSQPINAVGARVVSQLTERHLDAPALKQGFFNYLRSARSSPNWRGLGPASGIAFTERELLAKFKDPAIRNHMVTEQYYRVSQATEELLPGHANWATFAVWASRQAGSAIRGEPLRGLSGFDADVSRSISHGNSLVASEIAPLFGAFAQTLGNNPNATFQDVWRAAGSPANKPLLREAFQNYFDAYQLRRLGGGADAIAEKILVANALVGQHEQTALQGDIDSSMRVAEFAFGGISLAWAMAGMLDLELPGRRLDLDRDLTGQFPQELRALSNPRARQLEQQYGGLRGTGTRDWPDFQQRMEYIFNLFRLNQRDASLLGEWMR